MKIKVEGTEYEFPAVDSLTMDETILLERTSGVGIETLIPGEAIPMGAVKAFVMIAVMRERPDVTEKELAAAIGKIKLTEMQDLLEKEEDDASPPSPEPSSADSGSTSGDDSNGDSEPSPDESPLASSGLQVLRTGSTSGRETSAA